MLGWELRREIGQNESIAHGGGGVSDDFPLAYAYAHQRTLRLADGPDEVHRASLAKLEFAKHLLMPGEVEMPVTRGS